MKYEEARKIGVFKQIILLESYQNCHFLSGRKKVGKKS